MSCFSRNRTTHLRHKLLGARPPSRGSEAEAGATDIPSWAEGEKPQVGESGKDFAKRVMDEKYGKGQYKTSPNSEFNKLKKYGDRHFMDPPKPK